MPVVVDYSICDNAEGCPAVSICDAGALYFDTKKRRVGYDREKCRDCGTCMNYCGPAAVMHVPSEEEWQQLRAMVQG